MPHHRFFSDQPLELHSQIQLSDEEMHHLVHVMRSREGDLVEIINGKGFLALAKIASISKKEVSCFIEKLDHTPKKPCGFIIAQSLLKPNSLELVIEKATELGADEIWLFPGAQSEKKELSENQQTRLTKHLLSAMKQCGRLYLPPLRYFKNLEALLKEASGSFFYGDVSPSAPLFLQALRETKPNQAVFIVGCEKGFHKKEEDLLNKHRAKGVSLHSNILRAETAPIAASALLSHYYLGQPD